MAWQNDVSYSDPRYGVEKILVFPDIDVSAVAGIKGKMVLTEDIRVTEAGAWVTTIVGSGVAIFTVSQSDAAVTVATVTCATQADGSSVAGATTAQTTITNATALVSGTSIIVTTTQTVDAGGVVTAYVKYRADEYNY